MATPADDAPRPAPVPAPLPAPVPAPSAPLATVVRGAGHRLVLVHGFTQNAACWGPVADDLARDHEVVLVDAPGHGRSSAVVVPFEEGAALIGAAGGAAPATYVGYSMGGRYALRLALDDPARVERLVLIGASPGLADPVEREVRRVADESLATHLERVGLGAFLDEWLAQPLFSTLAEPVRCVRERLANTVPGLIGSLHTAGTGAMEPMWDRLGELRMPVLLVTGALDAKFTAIAEDMAAAIGPNALHVVLPDAGHTAHLERPDAFLSAVRAWLRSDRAVPG